MRGSFVLFSYKQPSHGSKLRCGVVTNARDTNEQPIAVKSINNGYRRFDNAFRRSQMLINVVGVRKKNNKAFYAERTNWALVVPFVGYPLLWAQKFFK